MGETAGVCADRGRHDRSVIFVYDDTAMPFIVTEPCIQCKYTDCVAVCPMDCFVEGPNFLVIDPDLSLIHI